MFASFFFALVFNLIPLSTVVLDAWIMLMVVCWRALRLHPQLRDCSWCHFTYCCWMKCANNHNIWLKLMACIKFTQSRTQAVFILILPPCGGFMETWMLFVGLEVSARSVMTKNRILFGVFNQMFTVWSHNTQDSHSNGIKSSAQRDKFTQM